MIFVIKNIKKIPFNKNRIKKISENCGIYMFCDIKTKVIYIGKSKNLKKRIDSYFSLKLSPKTLKMLGETKYFSIINVDSEIEALLLEAKMIKYFKPMYNVLLKDDKNPLYIQITNEKYPRVLTARKNKEAEGNLLFIGPFPSSANVVYVLKMLRRLVPYSDHKIEKKECFYNQIGLCEPCPSYCEKQSEETKIYLHKKYNDNIKILKNILEGSIDTVKNNFMKNMKHYSKTKQFEKALEEKKRLEVLEYITKPVTPAEFYIENPNLYEDVRNDEMKNLNNILSNYLELKKPIVRVECFDVSHISGTNPTASMVTFLNGNPDKKFYRHFSIRQTNGNNDYSSLKEVAKRRLKHLKRWGTPDLIIVDGGKGQVSSFNEEFKNYDIPVIGITKKVKRLIVPINEKNKTGFLSVNINESKALNLIERMRDEAHRFARRYHKILVKRNLFKIK